MKVQWNFEDFRLGQPGFFAAHWRRRTDEELPKLGRKRVPVMITVGAATAMFRSNPATYFPRKLFVRRASLVACEMEAATSVTSGSFLFEPPEFRGTAASCRRPLLSHCRAGQLRIHFGRRATPWLSRSMAKTTPYNTPCVVSGCEPAFYVTVWLVIFFSSEFI